MKYQYIDFSIINTELHCIININLLTKAIMFLIHLLTVYKGFESHIFSMYYYTEMR